MRSPPALGGVTLSGFGFSETWAARIEGVLTFHFLGGEGVANLFRESSAQRSGLRAFFELPDWTVRPHFVRHIGVDPFGIGFEPIDLGADEAALLSIELARDRDPAPPGEIAA